MAVDQTGGFKKTYEDIQTIMSNSSVLVVIEAPFKEGVFLPSKFVDFVQTGRAIIAVSPSVGSLNDIISAYGGGIAVDCHSPLAVAKAIETLYAAWKSGTIDEKYGSFQLFDLFGEQRVIGDYRKLFKRVYFDLK